MPKWGFGLRRRPGYQWRTLAHHDSVAVDSLQQRYEPKNAVCFDELVIDNWFHLEQMDDRSWWMDVGGHHINVYIPSSASKPVEVYVGIGDGGGDPTALKIDGRDLRAEVTKLREDRRLLLEIIGTLYTQRGKAAVDLRQRVREAFGDARRVVASTGEAACDD